MKKSEWIESEIEAGQKDGRKIGFPTINLSPNSLPTETKHGVYACLVKVDTQEDKYFTGALYYGPRYVSDEEKIILEIYILDFDQDIYGQSVDFQLIDFIRPPLDFRSFVEMKKQIADDVSRVKAALLK